MFSYSLLLAVVTWHATG